VLTIPRSIQVHPGRLAGALAATGGLVSLLAAALPARPGGLGRLDVLVPGLLGSGSAVATLAVGLGLLVLAAGFWWRHQAAIPIASTALAVSATVHLRVGSGPAAAVVEAFLAGLLLAQRDRWPRRQRRVRPGR
jgi:hypothetical protein